MFNSTYSRVANFWGKRGGSMGKVNLEYSRYTYFGGDILYLGKMTFWK